MSDSAEQGLRVGVDVGGTFTDLVVLDPVSHRVRLAKVPSTLDNQASGVLAALAAADVDLEATASIVHGTTTTTNAVLERKLSRTGLITTRGFRDVLELGRRTRPSAYGMTGQFEPIVPRDLRLEVDERMDAHGHPRVPLDEEGVAKAVRQLLTAGCETLVIHFLHACTNPAHEARAAEIARDIWPDEHVTAAHELVSESREFERGATAAINASVRPLLARYVTRLLDELAARGYQGDVLVVNGNGGMVSAGQVSKEAAKTVMSGPASGVMAAAWTGRAANRPNLITYDMGGTSTDVALIRDAEPAVSNETELEYGMPIHVPMVDVRTVGAGGGSIARVSGGGLLAVGPDSAGASPGPICFGRGGMQPTIADANALLGRLDMTSLAGGNAASAEHRMPLLEIFSRELGEPLGLDAVDAAAAVLHVADTRMAGAVRMVSVSLGADPRDFSLFAFGGAGPLHAASIARELAVPTVLVPPRPGITNALGCLVADLRHDFVDTFSRPLDALDPADLHERLATRIADGERLVRGHGTTLLGIRHTLAVDMRFVGQTHLLRVALPSPTPTVAALRAAFEEAYFARFRVDLEDIRAALVNVVVSVIGVRPNVDPAGLLDPAERCASIEHALISEREVHVGGGWCTTPVYRRERLPLDAVIEGPAIIEQMDTTTLLPAGDRLEGDAFGNVILHISARSEGPIDADDASAGMSRATGSDGRGEPQPLESSR